jgi:poly [ADP-ribose] polymerase 1
MICFSCRSWGRIGTTIGSSKVEQCDSFQEALLQFETHYRDKTGNDWHARDNFVKRPQMYCPLDVDYGESSATESSLNAANSTVTSELPSAVQELIKMLFNVDTMKKVMMEFELDLEKMPLGKLSKKQIEKAYSVLSELSTLITTGGRQTQFIDATNRFYTLVPHAFGVAQPTLIETLEEVKNKTEMLDSLLEIELAYSLLNTKVKGEKHPVDEHYAQLKTEMEPMTHESEEFKLLEQYVHNTHGATHTNYELEVLEIFKVRRENEHRRYKPFKKLHNRKLLWHGSRLTNFVGILSQGLRIAPPEAPPTGYMFGKGIYFADMVGFALFITYLK